MVNLFFRVFFVAPANQKIRILALGGASRLRFVLVEHRAIEECL
jgi:hypothetical protein